MFLVAVAAAASTSVDLLSFENIEWWRVVQSCQANISKKMACSDLELINPLMTRICVGTLKKLSDKNSFFQKQKSKNLSLDNYNFSLEKCNTSKEISEIPHRVNATVIGSSNL